MRSWKLRSVMLCLLLVGVSYFNSAAFGQVKPVELNYSMYFPGQSPTVVSANQWGKEIEKRTNGRIKVTVFPGGTFLPGDKCYDGVVKGITDIGWAVLAFTRGRFPLSEVVDLPLGYKTAVAATGLCNAYYNKFKPKELDEVQIMYIIGHGPGTLFSVKPINKVEDMKGMKIRCTGLAAKIAASLGGTPVAMPAGEAYDAMSRGVVEGALGPMEAWDVWRWGEVTKYAIRMPGTAYTSAMAIVMNKKKWNALPPDIQKIMEKVNDEWIQNDGKLFDANDKLGENFGLKLGNKITSFSQEENEKSAKAVRPLVDDYLKKMKELGLPGDEAYKFCMDRLNELQ